MEFKRYDIDISSEVPAKQLVFWDSCYMVVFIKRRQTFVSGARSINAHFRNKPGDSSLLAAINTGPIFASKYELNHCNLQLVFGISFQRFRSAIQYLVRKTELPVIRS